MLKARRAWRRIKELWPVFLLAFVYVVAYFSPDYVISTFLIKYKVFSVSIILLIVSLIGFLEMLGGYIGWSHFRGLMEKWLRDDIEFVKQIKGEEKTKDFVQWLKVQFARKYFVFLNGSQSGPAPKRWLVRHIDGIFKWMVIAGKGGGCVTMFLLGLTPVPGFRVFPDVLCGTTRWKAGFIALSLGNFLKTMGFVYFWSWLFGS